MYVFLHFVEALSACVHAHVHDGLHGAGEHCAAASARKAAAATSAWMIGSQVRRDHRSCVAADLSHEYEGACFAPHPHQSRSVSNGAHHLLARLHSAQHIHRVQQASEPCSASRAQTHRPSMLLLMLRLMVHLLGACSCCSSLHQFHNYHHLHERTQAACHQMHPLLQAQHEHSAMQNAHWNQCVHLCAIVISNQSAKVLLPMVQMSLC